MNLILRKFENLVFIKAKEYFTMELCSVDINLYIGKLEFVRIKTKEIIIKNIL